MELLDKSTYGPDSLLQTESVYDKREDKQWDEAKLEDWEFKRNGSREWEGRPGAEETLLSLGAGMR